MAAISRGSPVALDQHISHLNTFAKGKGETMTQQETPQVIGVRHVGLSARSGASMS